MEKRLNLNDLEDLFQSVIIGVLKKKGNNLKEDDLINIFKNYADTIEPATDEIAEVLFESLKESQQGALDDWKGYYSDFELRHNKLWETALNDLQALIIASYEVGEAFSKKYLTATPDDADIKLSVLVALHARSIQVANEVLCLLKSGYADGAHARWRTAHEIAVITEFLTRCSRVTINKYLEHEHIESYKAMIEYQDHVNNLGFKSLSKKEIDDFKIVRDNLIKKYGKEFLGPYGWAAKKLNNKKPNFSSIEQAVGTDYLRPYYRMASHNVHANPKGISFRLGMTDETKILLSGPSNYGLFDPGQCIALTLGQINTSLLNSRPNIDSEVYSKVIMRFVDLVIDGFSEIYNIMKKPKF